MLRLTLIRIILTSPASTKDSGAGQCEVFHCRHRFVADTEHPVDSLPKTSLITGRIRPAPSVPDNPKEAELDKGRRISDRFHV